MEGALPPANAEVYLPGVLSALRGPDESLWLGTSRGLARYVAVSQRGLTYRTNLEAFPDLTTGAVSAIRIDERGIIWFCADRGLFRYDGRDFWQFQEGHWARLGRADTLYDGSPEPPERGMWRFDREADAWQRWDEDSSVWVAPDPALRSSDGPAVVDVTWADGLAADLGAWDGLAFSASAPEDASSFVVRVKPEDTRIVNGGIPFVPRLPPGESLWRYLSLEPESVPAPSDLPFWTVEGRLIPPPEMDAPGPGRYDITTPPPPSDFDASVFAYNPAARVWMLWEPVQPLGVLVRLKELAPGERIDPAIVDRVWQGIGQVRPAGIRAMLAVEEEIVRGKDNGTAS
jgi:hypothetical protein